MLLPAEFLQNHQAVVFLSAMSINGLTLGSAPLVFSISDLTLIVWKQLTYTSIKSGVIAIVK